MKLLIIKTKENKAVSIFNKVNSVHTIVLNKMKTPPKYTYIKRFFKLFLYNLNHDQVFFKINNLIFVM